MTDFISGFNLFGMALVVLLPFLVEGFKRAYKWYFGTDMPSRLVLCTVICSAWFLLGLSAVVSFNPNSSDVVKYILAGVLLPLAAIGAYETVQTMRGK